VVQFDHRVRLSLLIDSLAHRYDAFSNEPDLEPSTPQYEEEIQQLEEMAENIIMDWKALHSYKG
jgi:hypothetical protein